MKEKPKKVVAKITRVVTELAIVDLDRNGNVEEYDEWYEELDSKITELHEIREVRSVHPEN